MHLLGYLNNFDQFIPWLATGGKWTTPTTYTMNIRQGVMWSDGKPMTASDVPL